MRFTVKNREISPENGMLLFLIGDNADYKAQFEFDSEWSGVVKTARFVRGNNFQEVVLVNDECEIPIEVLKRGFLEIGVFSAEMTTTPCRILVKGSIKELGGMTAEPTPDVYRQIIKMIEDLEVVGVTDAQIEKAVREYLEENPVTGVDEAEVQSIVAEYINLHKEELKGDKGDKGDTGTSGKDGTDGVDGADGKSAYDIAVDNGFEGTETEWLESLKGKDGASGGESDNNYIKPLTESWFIAEQSPYVLDARNALETYWNDEIARRCSGASDYLYSKFDELANNGYCVKKQLTTVTHNGFVYSVNAYEFTYANDWIGGQDSYHVNNVSDLSQRLYNKPKILITSGVHGNERFTPVAVYEFMKKVCTDKDYVDIRTGFDFYVIPILNPTGIDADVRRNYQNIDINRDTESKQTEEMKALIAYVDEVTNEKQSKFLYAMDFHQAPTNDDVMSAFMSLPTNVVDEFVYGRFVNNGQKALKSIREYLELNDTTSQRVYAWRGQEGDTIRNLMSDYSECSTCWECSHYEQVYTKSNIRNNPTASLIHNSLLDITCRCLFDSSLIGTKYLGTETASKNTLTSITATKGKTNYQINDVLNVDDLTVTANYSDGTSNVVTNYTTNASGIDMTTAGVKALIITYTDGVVKTTTVTINVSEESSDNGLEVYNKFNGYLSASGKITTSSEAKQIHVYQVEPSKTYKVTAHITTYDKNIIYAQYPTFVNTNNTTLSNSNTKSPSSGDTSANVTIAEGNNFLYLYNTYACDIASGLGFTVEEV